MNGSKKMKQPKYNHDGYTSETRTFLDKYGNAQIVALSVVIMPIFFIIPFILNILTRRDFNAYMQKKEFARLYHWELMATIIIDGEKRNIIIQKTGQIDINFDKKSYTYYYKSLISNKIFVDIPLPEPTTGTLTIDELLFKTREKMGYEEYYKWSLFGKKNCQTFIKTLLESINLYDKSVLPDHFQSTVGDDETAFWEKHSCVLYAIDILAYISVYIYLLFRSTVNYIYKNLFPQFSNYMNM
jgi:hypothetical protein